MKIAGLVIGILLTIGAAIGCIIALALPSFTNNRVNLSEAMVVFVPSVLVLLLGLLISIVFAIFVLKGRKSPQ